MTEEKEIPVFLQKAKSLAKHVATTMLASGHATAATAAAAVLVVTAGLEIIEQNRAQTAEQDIRQSFTVANYDQSPGQYQFFNKKVFDEFMDSGKAIFVRNPYNPETVTLLASFDDPEALNKHLSDIDSGVAMKVNKRLYEHEEALLNGDETNGSFIQCPTNYAVIGSVKSDGCAIIHDFSSTEMLFVDYLQGQHSTITAEDYHSFVINHEFLHGSAELIQMRSALHKHHGQYAGESLVEGVADTGALISFYQAHGLAKTIEMTDALVNFRKETTPEGNGHDSQGKLLITLALIANNPTKFSQMSGPQIGKEAVDINFTYAKFDKWNVLAPELEDRMMLPQSPYKLAKRLASHRNQSPVTQQAYDLIGVSKWEFMGLTEDEQIDLIVEHSEELGKLAYATRLRDDGTSKVFYALQNSVVDPLSIGDIYPNVFENELAKHQRESMADHSYAAWAAKYGQADKSAERVVMSGNFRPPEL